LSHSSIGKCFLTSNGRGFQGSVLEVLYYLLSLSRLGRGGRPSKEDRELMFNEAKGKPRQRVF
jgi:hypothetical protein